VKEKMNEKDYSYSENEDNEIPNDLPLERITLESNYIKENIKAFQLIRKRNYIEATKTYKTCINIAEQLKDNYKIRDSHCNYSISLFYNGKIEESIKILNTNYKNHLKEQNLNDDMKNIILDLKILSNLSIANLSLNKIEDSKKSFNDLCNILEKQDDTQTQLNLIKIILYIFFRVDSLAEMNENINEKIIIEENSDQSELNKKIIKKILNSFHSYLKNNDIKIWINCLKEEIENLKSINDYNGMIFAIFNLESSLYIKSVEEKDDKNIQSSLSKFSSLIKVLLGENNFDESNVKIILNNIKQKMKQAVDMYKKLYNLESNAIMKLRDKKINVEKEKKSNNDYNMNSPILVKILLKNSLKYVKNYIKDQNLCKQIEGQITKTIQVLSDKNYNNFSIKLNSISPEISKVILKLLNNLLSIYSKCKLRNYINIYRNNIGKKKIKNTNIFLDQFIDSYYKGIQLGDSLVKINFNNKSTKTHFYKLHLKKNCIQVYQKENDIDVYKEININSIIKITFGIHSQNLKNKIGSLPNHQAWLYMSFILSNRSLDLCLNENQIKKWFYGLSKYLKTVNKEYKSISRSKYILNRCKMKMAYKIINSNLKNKINNSETKLKIGKVNETGMNKISFIKLLLLYKTITN
jgi:hypothetical protein